MQLEVRCGDITTFAADAIVNAANRRMRGGGGVDGAIHAAGGPAILAACVEQFPDGLATGDAGATTAGDLSARWVIHVVGPNRHAGETDPQLLASCYRRALEVADDLGAVTMAFPLVGAGVYGWSLDEAVDVAVSTLLSTRTSVRSATLVAFGADAETAIKHRLDRS